MQIYVERTSRLAVFVRLHELNRNWDYTIYRNNCILSNQTEKIVDDSS